MKIMSFQDVNTEEPKPGWTRLSLAHAKNFSIAYFYRSAGHTWPQHQHPSEKVTIIIQGKMKVVCSDGTEHALGQGDSVYFAPNEMHRIEHAGTEQAVGIDIFSPARSCDLWMNQ
ncbi:cupin domain-containing protein [candidate division KSB1 bacterium]|nr:MAG: cupin domain-containing protein [candidate division KSB1 bacterium]